MSALPQLKKIKAVFFDIDDTFSWEGKIPSDAYSALWKLSQAGFYTVPVTGRPAGWCDMIARMWPVSAVVGENGAFHLSLKKKEGHSHLIKTYLEPLNIRQKNEEKLSALKKAVIKKFPEAEFASDQSFREFDFAVDYCEDVPRWTDRRVKELIEFCRKQGASAKLSSIHVNVWYGHYDKWTCVQKLLQKFGIKDLNHVVYLGDSPNDEPFFAALPFTVGVANVKEFLPNLTHTPQHITKKPGGHGFAEFAKMLLSKRKRSL